MPNEKKVTFFACGNGDSVLLECEDAVILTDINYRQATQDDNDSDVPDFAEDIRDACAKDTLDAFVLTHPDEDHCRGIGEIFHLGSPKNWEKDPKEGPVLIRINEIWCSPYAVNPHYVTDGAKPMLDEIKRRNNLKGTVEANVDGNRLKVLDTESAKDGYIGSFKWELISPTPDEANIAPPDKEGNKNSSNPSSLGIVWSIKSNDYENRIMLLGDATVDVLERINRDVNSSILEWGILLSPHHCSRRSLGRVLEKGTKAERFEKSSEAIEAVSHQKDDGHIVSSSRKFKKGGPTPPHPDAKKEYLENLARGGTPTDRDKDRFHCTGEGPDKGKPEKVVFDLTRSGPTPRRAVKSRAAIATSAVGAGGSYGK